MSEAVITVTSSTEELFTCAELKNWLKVDADMTADDDLIRGLLQTAIERYMAYTRRVPLWTTFESAVPRFPCAGGMTLPRYPLVSVTSIRGFTDTDATDTGGTAMSSSGYYVDTLSQPGAVVPLSGATYPTATRVANAGIVRFVAGESSVASGVPDDVKTTIQTMVARAYEHRGDEAQMELAMVDAIPPESDIAPDWG